MKQDSRHLYHNICNSSLFVSDFLAKNAEIIKQDTLFMPSQLEFLWNAEEHRDDYMYAEQLTYAVNQLSRLIAPLSVFEQLTADWTDLEVRAAEEVIARALRAKSLSRRQKIKSLLVRYMLRNLFVSKVKKGQGDQRFVVKVADFDPTPLRAELNKLNPHWWSIDTRRQNNITHHQKTWSLILRQSPNKTEFYKPIDQKHESLATLTADLLPKTHAAILQLANELGIGLGRVAVVKLRPKAQAYRHYDSERHLAGRKRYHLVLDSAQSGNILESGSERVEVKPGEVWFFDNKAMHRAVNNSDQYRVHVIFDGYPLNEKVDY